MRRRPLFFFFFLVLSLTRWCGLGWAAAQERDVRITVDAKPFPSLKGAVFQREPYLALKSLVHLHAETIYDPEKGTATIGFGRYKLLLTAGSCEAIFDGRPLRGARAPVSEGEEFWVPPAWLAPFGLKYSWDEKNNILALRWTRPYLLRVYLDKMGPEPRLVLEGTSPLRATVFKLVQPDRLVVDLEGCYLYDGLALEEGASEYFYRLRAAQNRPGVLRLVADLRQPVGFRVDTAEAADGRLGISLHRLVFGAEIVREETGSAVVIRTNHPVPWQQVQAAPDRLLLELEPATLVGPAAILPGDGEWCRGISYRQATPDRVKVEILLSRGETVVETSAADATKIVVRPARSLARLAWREDGHGLVLTADRSLEISARNDPDPTRLVLTIPYATAAAEQGERPRGTVKRYRVQPIRPGNEVEIVLELRYEAQFRLETSPDRRRVELIFTPPLAGKTIVLDPGHGGIETGAIGRVLGLREKEVNLDIAFRLKALLEEAGAVVQLTRVDDTYVPLLARAFFANRLPADIFLSIHANAHNDPNINGVEVYYYPGREEAGRLAGLILEEMAGTLGLFPRGAKTSDFAVLRDSQLVAVLVEVAFLSHPKEEEALATEDFRARAASAIARAMIRFARGERAKEETPPTGETAPEEREDQAPSP
ncbi:MAG: AMIN domain-containing protein [Firmicutes bacterium]|nr:AMIN domain-containing protein [Bacillota bacterium]